MKTSSRRAWIVEDQTLILVKPYVAAEELRASGFKPMYVRTLRAWCVDRKRMGDAIALLEDRGFLVQVNLPVPADHDAHRGVDAAVHRGDDLVVSGDKDLVVQLTLFDPPVRAGAA